MTCCGPAASGGYVGCTFFLYMNFYTLMASLPLFVVDSLGGDQQTIGFVSGMFIVAAVLSRPFAGKWVDEYGKKLFLFLSLTVYLVCTFFYFIVSSLPGLLVLRLIKNKRI